MGKAIPDRWLPYSSLGKVIEGTRFICFKVPLKKAVLEMSKKQGLEIDDMWDLETLLKRVPKLKYVIDLTNTSRYYEPRELEAAGVEHVKISMPGRVIPPEPVVKVFIDTVERFLRRGDGDDTLIGVHCTHGLNRTGYMICRYLKDRLGMAPDKAIEIFEGARGHRIERENYINKLFGRQEAAPSKTRKSEVPRNWRATSKSMQTFGSNKYVPKQPHSNTAGKDFASSTSFASANTFELLSIDRKNNQTNKRPETISWRQTPVSDKQSTFANVTRVKAGPQKCDRDVLRQPNMKKNRPQNVDNLINPFSQNEFERDPSLMAVRQESVRAEKLVTPLLNSRHSAFIAEIETPTPTMPKKIRNH